MPVSTRRNPLDYEDRAREDDLSTVDHREEIPQEQSQLDTSSGAPRAGAGRSASLFDRMRASLGGVDAPEVSDDQGDQAAVGPPVFSESQQNELKNLFDANSDKILEAMRAMLESTKPPDRTGGSTLAGGRPAEGENRERCISLTPLYASIVPRFQKCRSFACGRAALPGPSVRHHEATR